MLGWVDEAAGNDAAGLHRHVIKQLLAHIFGDVDQDRPGPPRGRDEKGLSNHAGQIRWIAHQPGVLHDRQRDAEDVGLLEGIGADHRPGHLSGDHHHRHRVHLRGGDAGHQVGGTGAGGAKANANFAGGAGVGIGGMGAALLMAHQEVLQLTAGFGLVELVVDRQDCAAGVAKDVRHPMAVQRIHQGIGTADALGCTHCCGAGGRGREGHRCTQA